MNGIQKSLRSLLLLAMICSLSACASKPQSYKQNHNDSSRIDSQTNPPDSSEVSESVSSESSEVSESVYSLESSEASESVYSSETIPADTTPCVPDSMYQSKIQSFTDAWKSLYADSYDTDIDVLPCVYHIPDTSTHRETVQIVYHLENSYGYKDLSIGYVYQYYSSDDIWEQIYAPSSYDSIAFEIYWDNFPRHWSDKKYDFDYTIDILDIDTRTQTITISYVMDDSRYGISHHKEGAQTIGYSLSGSCYYAELVDGFTYPIYFDLYGLICYNV